MEKKEEESQWEMIYFKTTVFTYSWVIWITWSYQPVLSYCLQKDTTGVCIHDTQIM